MTKTSASQPLTPTKEALLLNITRIVIKTIQNTLGTTADYPFLTCVCVAESLQFAGIQSTILFGQAHWVEVLENHRPIWVGCSGENIHFWVETQSQEIIDLVAFSHHKRLEQILPSLKSILGPPLLWSQQVPAFYHFHPKGAADFGELAPQEEILLSRLKKTLFDSLQECLTDEHGLPPDEPLLLSGHRVLENPQQDFARYDRSLRVFGLPPLHPQQKDLS